MARINHVALKVTDLETATKFYENVFGFRQVGTGRSRGHISRHLTDGYVDLALMVYDSENDPEAKLVGEGPAIHHFGIEVEGRQEFIDKIQANGGTLLSKPDSGTVKFRSPDGTIAEWFGCTADIEEHKRVEAALDVEARVTERRLRLAAGLIPETL